MSKEKPPMVTVTLTKAAVPNARPPAAPAPPAFGNWQLGIANIVTLTKDFAKEARTFQEHVNSKLLAGRELDSAIAEKQAIIKDLEKTVAHLRQEAANLHTTIANLDEKKKAMETNLAMSKRRRKLAIDDGEEEV